MARLSVYNRNRGAANDANDECAVSVGTRPALARVVIGTCPAAARAVISTRPAAARVVIGTRPAAARAVIGTRPAAARPVIGTRPAASSAVIRSPAASTRNMVVVCVRTYVMALLVSQIGGVDGARPCGGFTLYKPDVGDDAEFIAFSVGSSKSFTATQWAVIPMEISIYNPGGHIDHTTNSFTAPVAGVYSFFFGGMAKELKMADLHLFTKKAESNAANVHVARVFSQSNFYASAAGNVIVEMDSGETATIWLYGRGDSSAALFGDANPSGPTTFFSGELKKKLE